MKRNVRKQNELLIEHARCEFECYVTSSRFQQYSVYFVLDDGLQSGKIQVSNFIRHKFSKYGEDIIYSKFFYTS